MLHSKLHPRLRAIIEEECLRYKIRVISIGIEEDHVHLYLSIPVVHPIPWVVGKLKGVASYKLRREFASHIKRYYWGKKMLWAVGYFVATVGEVNHDTVKKYVENQGKAEIEKECVEFKL